MAGKIVRYKPLIPRLALPFLYAALFISGVVSRSPCLVYKKDTVPCPAISLLRLSKLPLAIAIFLHYY